MRRTALALLCLAAAMPGAAVAADDAGGDLWTRQTLLGDLGGVRPWLKQYGAELALQETGELFGNPTGGLRQGAIYEGLTDLSLKMDFRPYYHWRGVFFVHALQIHGRGLSANDVGNLDTISNIEATPATRLRELWYEQHFGDWLRIRVGEQSADTEFIVSSTMRTLVNGTFGWPTLAATDLPAGGPAYPLGTPAVRVRIDINDALTFFTGVFNGNPVGPGIGNPQARDASGTAFRTGDGVLAISEVRYNPGNSPATGAYRLGAWYDSEPFPDRHLDFAGNSLASPASLGRALDHHGDFSVYGVVDQPIFPAADGSGLIAFTRAIGAPGDRNIVDFYLDGGLAYKGPFGRGDDVLALGLAYTKIGTAARQLDADIAASSGTSYPVRSSERLIELTYLAQLAPWLHLQPDLQYVVNPGGGIPNPLQPGSRVGNALVLGLRTVVAF